MLKTNESAENYLETILVLSQKKPVVRGVDIAEELGFKKSSVSVAMKNLREKEQIRVTPEGYIYLTDSGRAIAEMIYERHQLLSRGLMSLGVDEQTATEDACRIEHVISQESFEAERILLCCKKKTRKAPAKKWETFGRKEKRCRREENSGSVFFVMFIFRQSCADDV